MAEIKIIRLTPPNFEQITEIFPLVLHKHGILYAYGGAIYNPDGVEISPQLLAHEKRHIERQDEPELWWEAYLNSPQFRLKEELTAHIREYGATSRWDRNARNRYLHDIAQHLAGPLYGNMVSVAEAKRMILAGD